MFALNTIIVALVASAAVSTALPIVDTGLAASPDTVRAGLDVQSANTTLVDTNPTDTVPNGSTVHPDPADLTPPALPTGGSSHHDKVAPHNKGPNGVHRNDPQNSTDTGSEDDGYWNGDDNSTSRAPSSSDSDRNAGHDADEEYTLEYPAESAPTEGSSL